jgi:SAM-dependent methyltransferase
MADLSQSNPTARFTGLANIYARCRPTYPSAAIDQIVSRGRLGPHSLVVDVGCGTGISSRLFSRRGIPILGIEPNSDMRRQAELESAAPDALVPQYREGRAEVTGLANDVADVVLSAQAFHWFQCDIALREFHRILKPDGWVALMWNERDESDPFTAAYGAVVRTVKDSAAVEGPRAHAGEPLLRHPLYRDQVRLAVGNEQSCDEDGLLGRTFSSSWAPRDPTEAEAFAAAMREVFQRFQQGGQVVMRYVTSLYLGQWMGS